ncbi:MAG: hydrogenase [Candidatus Binatia bacterium]
MLLGIDTILVVVVLTDLLVLGSSRLATCIRSVALQGILLGVMTFVAQDGGPQLRTTLLAIASILIKGIAFPALLFRALREAEIRREIEPYVGYNLSILIGLAMLLLALWLSGHLPLPQLPISPLVVPVALCTSLIGLLVIVGRKKAITQVLGYLVLENGIYAFGVGVVPHSSLLVELGVLLDVFVAVFVMGITIFHINRQFDHIDTDRLILLKD